MFFAEQYFEKDSLKLAMNGDGTNPGFIQIIDEYGSTKSGNLARYYLGICYLKPVLINRPLIISKFQIKRYDYWTYGNWCYGDAYMELAIPKKLLIII